MHTRVHTHVSHSGQDQVPTLRAQTCVCPHISVLRTQAKTPAPTSDEASPRSPDRPGGVRSLLRRQSLRTGQSPRNFQKAAGGREGATHTSHGYVLQALPRCCLPTHPRLPQASCNNSPPAPRSARHVPCATTEPRPRGGGELAAGGPPRPSDISHAADMR